MAQIPSDFYVIDFETAWSQDYTLKKLSTTEYIIDPRFKVHCVSIMHAKDRKARVLTEPEFREWIETIDWSKTGVLCHHAHFDGLILSFRYGVYPAFYFDTLSMARPLMPVTVRLGLDPLAKRLGFKGKVRGAHLENTKGKWELTPRELKNLMAYAGDDAFDTLGIFKRLREYTTDQELQAIDITIAMYCDPTLRVDGQAVKRIVASERKRKLELYEAAGATPKQLGQSNWVAEQLRALGVEVPTKISAKTEKVVYAFSKTDIAFAALKEHPDERVRNLVLARLAVKSTLLEKRAERIAARAWLLAQPIYLIYWGAKTGRWSGGDGVNYQNLPARQESMRELRRSIAAAVGMKLVVGDSSMIEARLTAWVSGQDNIVEAFRAYDTGRGPDLYRVTASVAIFHVPVEEINDAQRFIGKTATLGLGFGAGPPKFRYMLAIGMMGKPVFITLEQAKEIVGAWRSANHMIKAAWYSLGNACKHAFLNQCEVVWDFANRLPITIFGAGGNGYIVLPNGTTLRYDNIEGGDDFTCEVRDGKTGRVKRKRLYGGILFENLIQALARATLTDYMIQFDEWLNTSKYKGQLASTTHDEIISCVLVRYAESARVHLQKLMSTPPKWAPTLPLNAKVQVMDVYNKD